MLPGPPHPYVGILLFLLPGVFVLGLVLILSRGLISPELPYIRKKAVELLKANYPDRESAQKQIVEGIKNYYHTRYP